MKNFKLGCYYQCYPDQKLVSSYLGTNPYYNRNWTFECRYVNSKLCMVDTYWDCYATEITPENEDVWEFVMDPKEVKVVSEDEYKYYANTDRIGKIPTDCGGYKYARYFVKKNAKPCSEWEIKVKSDYVKYLETKVNYIKQKINSLRISDSVVNCLVGNDWHNIKSQLTLVELTYLPNGRVLGEYVDDCEKLYIHELMDNEKQAVSQAAVGKLRTLKKYEDLQ